MRLANQDWDLSLMEGITDYYWNLEYNRNLNITNISITYG